MRSICLGLGFMVVGCAATVQVDDGAEPATSSSPEATTTPVATGEASATPSALPIEFPEAGTPADWKKPNPNGTADGGSCSKPDDCKSGVCEGEGCGAGSKAVCVSDARACTRDLRTYCGCDGKSFGGSGSCPGRPYQKPGACE